MSSSARAANFQGSEGLLLNIHSDELTPAPAPEAERDGAKPPHVRHATHKILPGDRVIIRIVATIVHADGRLDYMGERFPKPKLGVVAAVDAHMVLIEVTGRIIRSTGRASFLVAYEGHALRVHAQQIRLVESEVVS